MNMMPLYPYKVSEKHQGSKKVFIFMLFLLGIILFVSFYFAFFRKDVLPASQVHSHFKEALSQVCKTSSHPHLQYDGVHSFFYYLQRPQQHSCSSWVKIQRQKSDPRGPTLEERPNVEDLKEDVQYVCMPDSDEVSQNPCLVYSFTRRAEEDLHKHFQALGCVQHVFPPQASNDFAIQLKRNNSTNSNALLDQSSAVSEEDKYTYEISGHPRDTRSRVQSHLGWGNANTYEAQLLKVIALKHSGQRISLVNMDIQGGHWPVLMQIIHLWDVLDVQQISSKIELPDDVIKMSAEEMHLFFSDLHQVLEGLHCLGYELIRSEPLTPENDDTTLLKVGTEKYPLSYQVTWMKKKKI